VRFAVSNFAHVDSYEPNRPLKEYASLRTKKLLIAYIYLFIYVSLIGRLYMHNLTYSIKLVSLWNKQISYGMQFLFSKQKKETMLIKWLIK
jgi:hypothetical protein